MVVLVYIIDNSNSNSNSNRVIVVVNSSISSINYK